MLLTKKKPINFTKQDIEDTERLVKEINKTKTKEDKKETFSSIVRDRALAQIRKELKQIEK